MDKRKLQIVHEFDYEPTYIITADDDHADIATVEPGPDFQGWKTADEIVRRWNAYPELVEALRDLELRATQARIASNIGRPKLKDADFLREALKRIGTAARTLLDTLKTNGNYILDSLAYPLNGSSQ